MNYSSYSSTPGRGEYYYEKEAYASPSPTPSPRGAYYQQPQPTPRPATRAHFRNMSSSGYNDWSSPRPPHSSPRYTSDGQYATFNVSSSRSAQKSSFSSPRPKRERRSSYSYYRPSDSHGESDEDEIIEIDGVTYVLPARSRSSKRYSRDYYYNDYHGGRRTDQYYYVQVAQPSFEREASYATPRREPEGRRPGTSSRRASMSVPQSQPPPPRPQTARPPSAHKSNPKPAGQAPPPHRKATEADAKKHKIPSGYSLKNWDPAEEPILLLGSVFDANSLGKWVYDWTVFHHGPATPFAEMAGEMWLLLIQLAGKIKRSDEIGPRIRTKENKEMVEDFIESGERLTDKLRKLLKLCESPMLKMQKKNQSSLGQNSGVEFVKTMFGRERELEKTERFMQSIRLWNLRFDANCEEILRHPTR